MNGRAGRRRGARGGFSGLLALLLATPAPAAERSWWTVRLGEASAGSLSEEVVPLTGGRIATRSELRLRLDRLGSEIEMRLVSELVEGSDGRLLSARSEQELSRQRQVIAARVEGNRLRWRFVAADGTPAGPESELALPAELPGPQAARERTSAALRAPATRSAPPARSRAAGDLRSAYPH